MAKPAPRLPVLTGRDDDVRRIERLLDRDDVRLLTLTGAGGIGKTELARHLAAAVADRSDVAVVHIDVSRLTAEDLLPIVLAAEVGVVVGAAEDAWDVVARSIEGHPLLVVLDGAEHQLAAVATFAARAVASCTTLKILSTSRDPLGVPVEFEYGVAPLRLPDASDVVTAAALGEWSAPALFVERAREASGELVIDDAAAQSAVDIARRLDGVPLALELAAARARSLSLADVQAAIEQRLGALDSRLGPAQRPAALRATIQWTYELLDTDEQRVLRAVSVFAGSWTTQAASKVLGEPTARVEEYLGSLASKRLVRFERGLGTAAAQSRWAVLDTIREFARDELGRTPERFRRERALGDWCLSLATRADAELTGANQVRLLDELAAEHENFRLALATHAGEPLAAALAAALARYWSIRGHWIEARRALDAAVEAGAGSAAEQASVLFGAAYFAELQGELDRAETLQRRSEALWRDEANEFEVSRVLQRLGAIAVLRGDYPLARSLLDESLAIRVRIDDAPGVARLNADLGLLDAREGDFAGAAQRLSEAVDGLRSAGEIRELANALAVRAGVAIRLQDFELAARLLDEQVPLADAVRDEKLALSGQARRGSLAAARGDAATAELLLLDARQRARTLRDQRSEADVLGRLWPLARDRGEFDAAVRWAEDGLLLHRQVGNVRAEGATLCGLALLAVERGRAERARVDEAVEFCHRHDLVEFLEGLASDLAPVSEEWAEAVRSSLSEG